MKRIALPCLATFIKHAYARDQQAFRRRHNESLRPGALYDAAVVITLLITAVGFLAA